MAYAQKAQEYVILNNTYLWRFTRLNQALAEWLAQSAPPDHVAISQRPLQMYASFVQSKRVDDTYDQLLRIIPYKSQDVWWEPTQFEYHPVQDRFIESIEIRLTEANGTAFST